MDRAALVYSESVRMNPCPVCNSPMPVDEGYVTWCDQCGYNLAPHRPFMPAGSISKLKAELTSKAGDALFHELKKNGLTGPKITLVRLLTYAVSSIAVLLVLLSAAGGILLLAKGGWRGPFGWILALGFLGLAFMLLPRPTKRPEGILARVDYPSLYRLVDEIAASLHVPAINGIVLTPGFRVTSLQAGWRGQRYLQIALPLISILDREEITAVIAHEMAHFAAGDMRRAVWVASSIRTFFEWDSLIRPKTLWIQNFMAPIMFPILLLIWLIARAAWGLGYILCLLTNNDAQRSEYLADVLGSRVSGTPATLSALEKGHYGRLIGYFIQKAVLGGQRGGILDELPRFAAQIPSREGERIRRIELLPASRVDLAHPPTAYRLEFLKDHWAGSALYELSEDHESRIRTELRQAFPKIEKELVDAYRSSAYTEQAAKPMEENDWRIETLVMNDLAQK